NERESLGSGKGTRLPRLDGNEHIVSVVSQSDIQRQPAVQGPVISQEEARVVDGIEWNYRRVESGQLIGHTALETQDVVAGWNALEQRLTPAFQEVVDSGF